MNSILAYTGEIDDPAKAAGELFEQVGGFSFGKSSLAIIFAVDDTEFDMLYEELGKRWDFPIMGCTSLAMFMGDRGYKNDGISALLLTGDDVEITVGMTDELILDNYYDELEARYNELKSSHSDEIKLIISYGGLSMDEDDVPGDYPIQALSDISGGVPIYGGIASDTFSYDGVRVFCNGDVTSNGQVMALISGAIDPRFIVTNSIENRVSFSYDVTKASGSTVYELEGIPFTEVLKKENMYVDKRDVFGDYILSPFLVDIPKDNGSVEVGRCLSLLDGENGSGTFLGVVPEKAMLNVGIISQDDVNKSVNEAFDEAISELSGAEGEHHTLLCTSCCARFLALGSNASVEIDAYRDRLPEGVSLMGFYGYGEYCPINDDRSGTGYNMFHNFTFTILVI